MYCCITKRMDGKRSNPCKRHCWVVHLLLQTAPGFQRENHRLMQDGVASSRRGASSRARLLFKSTVRFPTARLIWAEDNGCGRRPPFLTLGVCCCISEHWTWREALPFGIVTTCSILHIPSVFYEAVYLVLYNTAERFRSPRTRVFHRCILTTYEYISYRSSILVPLQFFQFT